MAGKSALIILDGWGLNPDPGVSAIEAANTPYFDHLWSVYPHNTLITYGEDVGLPEGQMGNSEVGHLNIGAGRVIYQELARINKSIREKEINQNTALLNGIHNAKGTIHLIGLVSNGGVHSHVDHLIALAKICREHYAGKIVIHAFTDGRDVDPKSGLGFLRYVEKELSGREIPIASVIGRYYAMDRDKRWERTRLAYDLVVHGHGIKSKDIFREIENSYDENITDEFIKPICLVDENEFPVSTIADGDTVLFFNFRTDRPRQLTAVLTQHTVLEYEMSPLNIQMLTMTRYDEDFKNITILFENSDIRQTLGEYLASIGKTQVRIAETEKYPHVTYFFSGGREDPFPGEKRILIPSPKVATYDLQPEMSAIEVTEATMDFIKTNLPDFICLNYANTDMVGHTGVFSAAVKATETVDTCLSRLIPLCLELDYSIIIIADHGNSDVMVNEDGTPNTAHTKNPVPIIYVAEPLAGNTVLPGRLADVAPTLLFCMQLPVPDSMSGQVLIIS